MAVGVRAARAGCEEQGLAQVKQVESRSADVRAQALGIH